MKLILTFLLCTTLTDLYSQSPGFCKYIDTINGFSIEIPAGWYYGVNKEMPTIKLSALRKTTDTSDRHHENFNLNIMKVKNSSLELEYAKLIEAISDPGSLGIIKKGDVFLNGQPYKWLIEKHKSYIDSSIEMTDEMFLTYKNEKTYILTLDTFSKEFNKYETLFTKISNTLIILDK